MAYPKISVIMRFPACRGGTINAMMKTNTKPKLQNKMVVCSRTRATTNKERQKVGTARKCLL